MISSIADAILRHLPLALLSAGLTWWLLSSLHEAQLLREREALVQERAHALALRTRAEADLRRRAETALTRAEADRKALRAERNRAEARLEAAARESVGVADWLTQPVPEVLR